MNKQNKRQKDNNYLFSGIHRMDIRFNVNTFMEQKKHEIDLKTYHEQEEEGKHTHCKFIRINIELTS